MNVDDHPHWEAELRADPDIYDMTELEVFLGHVEGVDLWRCRMKGREGWAIVFCSATYFTRALWYWTPFDEEEPSNNRFTPMLPADHPVHTIAEAYRAIHQ